MMNIKYRGLICFAGAFAAKTAFDTWLKSYPEVTEEKRPASHRVCTFAYKLFTKASLAPLFAIHINGFYCAKLFRNTLLSAAFIPLSLEASDRISSWIVGEHHEKSFHFTDFENHPDKFQYTRDIFYKSLGYLTRKIIEPERISPFEPTHYARCGIAFFAEHVTTSSLAKGSIVHFKPHSPKKYLVSFSKPITKSFIFRVIAGASTLAEDLVDGRDFGQSFYSRSS